MKKWKVALIGCGSIADNTYLPRIKDIPEADMVAVCDIIPERAKDLSLIHISLFLVLAIIVRCLPGMRMAIPLL